MEISTFSRTIGLFPCIRLLSKNKNGIYKVTNKCLSTVALEKKTQNIVYSPLKDIHFSDNITIPEFVFENFGRHPHKIAVECCVTGRKYTFEELRRKSKIFGKAIRKKFKLNKTDVIALLLPNIPEFPICVLGALDAGLTITPINPSYKADEVKKQLLDSNAKLIITIGELWSLTQVSLNGLQHIPTIIIKTVQSQALPNGTINFQDCIEGDYDIDDINVSLDDLSLLPYSSGTTGLPKGVKLSTKNIMSNLMQLQQPCFTFTEPTTENHQDIVPGILPWFHIYGIIAILITNLRNLSKLVAFPKFTPDIYLDVLANYKPQVLYIVPPIVVMMNNSSMIKKEHLQSINIVCSGAAPLGALEEVKLQNKADKQISIVQGYGLTEASCCVALLPPSKKRELNLYGSVGIPVASTSIKVIPTDNSSTEPLGPNQLGELFIKGPQITKGYLNRPQETEDMFVDGWFKSGDVGYYDKNGCFYVTDRYKELIKVKGFQVAPAELEELIRDYPGVLDSAVIGIPHEKFGEVPRAYVVQSKGATINKKALEEYIARKVADFKQLKGGVVLIDSIPKTASGKVLRKELKLLATC